MKQEECKFLIMVEKSNKRCKHCGTPFRGDSDFCCQGCQYVYQLIRDEGFEQYYALKDKAVAAPIGTSVFEEKNDAALVEQWNQAETVSGNTVRRRFSLRGISCIGCVWLIEKLFYRVEGTSRIEIDTNNASISIEAQRDFDIAAFADEIQRFGYIIKPRNSAESGGESSLAASKIGVCGFLAMNSMAFTLPFYLGMDANDELAPLLRFVVVVLASFSVLFGGVFFFKRAWAALRSGTLHIDLPIALGIGVAYVGSCLGWAVGDDQLFYFDFISIFILLMLVGRWLQERITERNLKASAEERPYREFVDSVAEDGTIQSIEIERVVEGMHYRLTTGNWVPVKSKVLGESITVSLESINGESEPKVIAGGEVVPSGAILISSALSEFEALEPWDHALLKRLSEVENAYSASGDIMQVVLKTYILIVIGIACAGLTLWGMLAKDWVTAIQVGVSVLVVSCPCAIGLAYPMIQELCSGWLKSRGVFLRDNSMWARLHQVKDVFFDKTGTLTFETLKLLNPEDLRSLNNSAVDALYALVESNLHPVGRSLKTYLLLEFPPLSKTAKGYVKVRELVGFGVEATIENQKYWLKKSPKGSGESLFGCNDETLLSLRFEDWLRDDVKGCIAWLKSNQKEVHLISGDVDSKVKTMARSLGLNEQLSLGNLSPQEKADWIESKAKAAGMMIGDGANDAIAFEKAICRATPVIGRGVLEQHSDFFFLGYGLQGIVDVFKLGRLRSRVVREILFLTVFYNTFAVGLALSGWMNPLLAAVLMPLSSIVTVSWSTLRMSKAQLDRSIGASVS